VTKQMHFVSDRSLDQIQPKIIVTKDKKAISLMIGLIIG